MPILPILTNIALGSVAAPVVSSVAASLGESFNNLLELASGEDDSPAGSARATTSSDGLAETVSGSATRLELLRAELDVALKDFAALAVPRLRALGVDLSQPVELKSDGRQGVYATGFHSQRAEIERLFESDPALTDAFYQVAAKSSYLEKLHRSGSTSQHDFQLRLMGETAAVIAS